MANKRLRQTLSTSAALAVTGAIALSPVTILDQRPAVAATPRVATVDVTPTNVFHDLRTITEGAREAVRQSVDAVSRKAPDLWWTVHEHWPDADLLHWNYALVSDIFLAPVTPLIVGPLNDAIAEVVARNFPVLGDEIRQIPEFIEYAFVRLVGPLLSAIGGAGVAHSEIFYSMTTLRIEPFIEAIVRAPFHVVDGLLFGGYGDLGPLLQGEEGNYIPAPGLLTPWGKAPRVRDIKTPHDIVPPSVPEADVDADADLVDRVTDPVDAGPEADRSVAQIANRAESTEQTEVEVVAADAETPAQDIVAEDSAVPDTDTATDPETLTDTATETGESAEVGPRAGIRAGIKDFRSRVHNTVKKLTNRGSSSRPESGAGSENSDSAKSDSSDAE